MKLFKKLLLHKNEAGFSLIEIMVSIVITGFIGLGATISSLQVLTETSRNEDYTTASRNTMNAVFWISRDAQMAQTISGVAGFPETSALSLTWEDWNNSSHNATYSVQNGRLFRSYNVDGNINQSLIAEFINTSPDSTNCTSVNGTLILTITSSVGEGSRVVNVTRVREMTARPRL
jgi:prepilin-type N-terminal cleavage/methylation domain-containing protein